MATNFVKCSYKEIIDLNTESNKVTAIGIHTPTGDTPRKMFPGFFKQYRKYKYSGASLAFYPIAKLPADPLQVSYDAGEPGIDPRDLANPILVHGCHGEDMGQILNKLYGDNNGISDSLNLIEGGSNIPVVGTDPWYDLMERLYYKALTDRTWKQAGVQRGFRKGGLRPLLYTLGTNHQIMPSSQLSGMVLGDDGVPKMLGGLPTTEYEIDEEDEPDLLNNAVNKSNIQFFTPRLTRLGWMDTRNVITTNTSQEIPDSWNADTLETLFAQGMVDQINWAELPNIYMLMILLPPAYKTEMYFRVVITHYFKFKGFRGISMMPEQTGVPSLVTQEWNGSGPETKTFDDLPIDPPEGGNPRA
ncbi:putative capsid protein [Sheep faeces associated smacovirus 1]|uniref:Putative capsid protein n=1 Tax=Sheep faeces associated smacovirus 1 TaxID=1843756 RepID=A0A160HWH4_9VIRU|nr:putative capsid protein [Sheep faeces associated smacovirus 1]ANC51528.1 putative capsid protein [Sheep faeces associated smacovirus 1]